MHFAMPPRKTSRPPPYAARNKSSIGIPPAFKNLLRRDKARWIALIILGILGITWLMRRGDSRNITQGGGWSDANIPSVSIGSGPPVVIVTVMDPQQDPKWIAKIRKNREDYAKRHGYKTFFPTIAQYPLKMAPASWSRVPAVRHAMTLHPGATFFWYLDHTALIMNPSIAIHTEVLSSSRLESLALYDHSIVQPDGVIKTFPWLQGDHIDFVISQDKEGLAPNSFIVRNGQWAKFFLDSWFDPIYRSYNFQRAEMHALEHIVQWHGTILAKLAIVPQNFFNAYVVGPANTKDGPYKEGDLVATFHNCDWLGRDCPSEQAKYLSALEKLKHKQA